MEDPGRTWATESTTQGSSGFTDTEAVITGPAWVSKSTSSESTVSAQKSRVVDCPLRPVICLGTGSSF